MTKTQKEIVEQIRIELDDIVDYSNSLEMCISDIEILLEELKEA